MINAPAPTVLRTAGLCLRPWRPDDAEVLLRALTDPEYLRWNTHLVPVTDLAGARALLRAREEGWSTGEAATYAVTRDGEDGEVLGGISLSAIQPAVRTARVGYWVLAEHRGQRIAGRALDLVTDWAFGEVGLHRVELGHAVGHASSCRIARKHGYPAEGTLRDAMFATGRTDAFRDLHLHARLATDTR